MRVSDFVHHRAGNDNLALGQLMLSREMAASPVAHIGSQSTVTFLLQRERWGQHLPGPGAGSQLWRPMSDRGQPCPPGTRTIRQIQRSMPFGTEDR